MIRAADRGPVWICPDCIKRTCQWRRSMSVFQMNVEGLSAAKWSFFMSTSQNIAKSQCGRLCLHAAYNVSQKSSPLKLFAIFSLRLCVFSWNFVICCRFISTQAYQFCRFILIFNKMALIFPRVLIILPFQVSSFNQSLVMSGPVHPTLIHCRLGPILDF